MKLADRLSNVQRLDTHPRPEKRRNYYDETVRYILPLAERHRWFHDWYDTWRTEFRQLDETPVATGSIDVAGDDAERSDHDEREQVSSRL